MDYKIRTYEDVLDVTADRMEVLPEGIRFYTGGRLTAAFSRYLWIQEQPTTTPPVAEEPVADQDSTAGAAGDGATP